MPVAAEEKLVKNREARLQCPAATIRPENIRHIQDYFKWALKNGLNLSVVGGGRGGHCQRDGIVTVDMSAFNHIHIVLPKSLDHEGEAKDSPDTLAVVESGSTTGDIISRTMAIGLTVPLGSRPSVGAGLWLQGGIGHLARMQGLSCDACYCRCHCRECQNRRHSLPRQRT